MGTARDEIARMRAKRGDSDVSNLSHLSRHINEFSNPVVGCGVMFRTDYLSRLGKWIQMAKLMTIILIPIVGGWAFTITALVENVHNRSDTLYAQDIVEKSIFLGKLIFNIQQERDMSILYISRIGPGTKTFLIQKYDATDKAFEELWKWPVEFAANDDKTFRTKSNLLSYINRHRASVNPDTTGVYEEIVFYSDIIDFLISWMVNTIREAGFGNIWKSLIVFHKLTQCMLDTGAERAYGSMFFARGNFPDTTIKTLYFTRLNRFNYSYRSASYYSIIVDSLMLAEHSQREVTDAIMKFRTEIKNSNITSNMTSYAKAEDYYDNCTLRIEYLYNLHSQVSNRLITVINSSLTSISTNLAVYGVIVTMVFLAFPVIVIFAEALMSNIQSYSKVLVEATTELGLEQSKTTSLLYQMLPKSVADSLKRRSKVESEYYKSATVMFSSIVNFTQMSIEYSALELTDLLNVLYTAIDEQIERFDVYKVETINDTYMVVSGVPIPNSDRHASEIAAFGLDVLDMVQRTISHTPKIRTPVQLQLGASSGSVSAGVVGTVMLRYCLFGDTVNSASRMKSYSQPNRFHISETTAKILERSPDKFTILCRGVLDIKGKGEMNTYWLQPAVAGTHSEPLDTKWTLPGEVDCRHGEHSVMEAAPISG